MRRLPFTVRVVALNCIAAILSVAPVAYAQELLPNLEPFPASDFQLTDGGNTLRFSTTTWNRGAGPMQLRGGEILVPGTPTDPGTQRVYQQIYKADGSIREVAVGTFEYHGGSHNHFHLEDYARYTLHPIDGSFDRPGTKIS